MKKQEERDKQFKPNSKLDRIKRSSLPKQLDGTILVQNLQPKGDPKVKELAELIRRVRLEYHDRFVQKPKLDRSKTEIIFTMEDYLNPKGVLCEYIRRLPRIQQEAQQNQQGLAKDH